MDILNNIVYGLISIDLINGKNLIKIGMCENYKNRKSTYITGYPYNSPTLIFVILCETIDEANDIEDLLHTELYEYSTTQEEEIYNDGGTEWFNIEDFNISIIKDILQNEGYTNKILIDNELIEFEENEKRKYREHIQKQINQKNLYRKNKNRKLKNAIDNFKNNKNESNKRKWNEREYQKSIISNGYNKLLEVSKFCLELATGGGKTYIVYKILSMILSDVIIIFSPRKKINTQNVDKKYLSLLNNKYEIFNCSKDKNFEEFKNKCQQENKKIIIIGCPQKVKENIYEIIETYNLNNILIWYDEFHHTIENWIDTLEHNRYNKFYLQDNNKIKYRIFTSASPDKNKVKENTNIFGELYSPIKVKELISQGWLCNINCKILENESSDLNLLDWILNTFKENNKKFGFSFHNRVDNAFNLFYMHYLHYLNKKTTIKPYLLIDKSGLEKKNIELLKTIKLDYNFEDIKNFEDNPNSIGYVVKQYDMGYDFDKLDYIVFSDKKMSFKDIIQSIGRGTRSDKNGIDGKNKNKELLIMLPTFITNEDNNNYKNIIEVLRYLILDLDLDILKSLINPIKKNNDINNYNNSLDYNGLDYNGLEENKSKLLDLLYANNLLQKINIKTLSKLCLRYNIKTDEDFIKFKNRNSSLNLKNNLYDYPGFYWKNILDPDNELYYSSKSECEKSKMNIINKIQNLEEDECEMLMEDIYDNVWKKLNELDCKIPPYPDLDKYYPQL